MLRERKVVELYKKKGIVKGESNYSIIDNIIKSIILRSPLFEFMLRMY